MSKEAALYYKKIGLSVIPVKPDKKPFIKWEPYQTKPASEKQIRQWWKKWPAANVGLVTGEISGLIVVDADSEQGRDAINEFIPENLLMPVAKSPKGWHYYFQYEDGISNGVRILTDCDIRSSGGYIIAPPSKTKYGENGQSQGGEYKWLPNLKITDAQPAKMPGGLSDILRSGGATPASASSVSIKKKDDPYNRKNTLYRGAQHSPQTGPIQTATTATNRNNRNISFEKGFRDESLFHVATCLHRGGMDAANISKTLHLIGSICSPAFPAKEINEKLKSVLKKADRSKTNLTGEVRDFVTATWGNFSATEALQTATNATWEDRKKVRTILGRLVKEGLIERVEKCNGWYRKVDDDCRPIDWAKCETDYRDIWLPFGLGEMAGIQPGNILVFAGAKDSGKTAAMMNIAKENRRKYKVHYFSSEMGGPEFKLRANKFPDLTPEQWGINFYERGGDFQDVIKPGPENLNIIDYLEVTKDFYLVGDFIKTIWAKLKGSICIIALQKAPGVDLGSGGRFSLEKARLYVALDYGAARIVSCKNFRSESSVGNPRGMEYTYKLIDGCRYKKSLGWHTPAPQAQ